MLRSVRHASVLLVALATASASSPIAHAAVVSHAAARKSAVATPTRGGSTASRTAPQGPAKVGAQRGKTIIRRPFKRGANTQLQASWTINGNTYASVREYNDLRGGAMELLRRYPPDQYFFVGLGRDPAPIIAFLQNLGGKDLAVNLPGTSNIGWVGVRDAVLAEHIEAAIPASILTGERRIVLVDVSRTGKTPATFGPLMDRYLKSHGGKPGALKVSMGSSRVMRRNTAHFANLTAWIDTTAWPDIDLYPWGKYEGSWTPQRGGKGIAEHQRHSMNTGSPPTETNPGYAAFRDAIMARMEQDATLDELLAALPGADASATHEEPARQVIASAPPVVAPAPPVKTPAVQRWAPAPTPPKPTPIATATTKPTAWPWAPQITLWVRPSPLVPTAALSLRNPRFEEQREKQARRAAKDAKRIAKGERPKGNEDSEIEPETYDYLDPQEYGAIRDGALAIMQRHNPQTTYFVGLGRSSTALVAFMEGLGTDVATYLPADGLSKLAAQGSGRALDTVAKRQIFALFETFIPKQAIGGTRKLVLFQQSDSGASLPFMQALLEEWLRLKASPTKVSSFALSTKPIRVPGLERLDISQNDELQELGSGKYYAVAPYGYFRPGKNALTDVVAAGPAPVRRTATYGKFQAAMKSLMSHDAVVQRALPSLTTNQK